MTSAERPPVHRGRKIGGRVLTIVASCLLSGCAARPQLQRPVVVSAHAYTESPAATVSADSRHGGVQRFVSAAGMHTRWWSSLGARQLDALIERALEESPTIVAAESNLRRARELLAAHSGANNFPKVDASLGTQRQRFNPAALGQSGGGREFSLYSSAVVVRYNLDLAGSNRRILEGLAARADFQRYQLEGARLSLAASITVSAIGQAEKAATLAVLTRILEAQEAQLEITRERTEIGHSAQDDLLAMRTEVERTRASVAAAKKKLEESTRLLATLGGYAPESPDVPAFTLNDFLLPSDLPLVVPSELLKRRPDLRAAEALVNAANADYGVAVAKLYPQVSIGASIGSQAFNPSVLFDSANQTWGLVGQILQPLIHRGLSAEKRAALAGFDAATAHYQHAVLDAFRSVADVLGAITRGAEVLAAHANTETSTRALLESTRRRHGFGAASYFELLSAEQQAQQAALDVIDSRAQRLVDTVTLYQAIGGGYLQEDTMTTDNAVAVHNRP